jgi:Domain of unknown function (DUF4124)
MQSPSAEGRQVLRALSVVLVSAILLASIAIAPASAHGPRGFGGSRGFHRGGVQGFNPGGGFQGFNPRGGFQGFNPGHAGRFTPPRFSKHGHFFPNHRFHRSFATGGYFIGAYGAPFYYGSTLGGPLLYDTSAYGPSPVSSAPPVYVSVVVPGASNAVPAVPARPSVIEYPEGRYELRGDGMSTPYNWVWIPNPPAAPPASTSPPTAPAPSSGDRSPVRRSQLYRWVDEQGVIHLTDNADIVPEQFRKPSKRNNSL